MPVDDYHCTKENDIEEIKKKVSRIDFLEQLMTEARNDIKSLLKFKWSSDGSNKTLQMWTIILVPCIVTFALNIVFIFIQRSGK